MYPASHRSGARLAPSQAGTEVTSRSVSKRLEQPIAPGDFHAFERRVERFPRSPCVKRLQQRRVAGDAPVRERRQYGRIARPKSRDARSAPLLGCSPSPALQGVSQDREDRGRGRDRYVQPRLVQLGGRHVIPRIVELPTSAGCSQLAVIAHCFRLAHDSRWLDTPGSGRRAHSGRPLRSGRSTSRNIEAFQRLRPQGRAHVLTQRSSHERSSPVTHASPNCSLPGARTRCTTSRSTRPRDGLCLSGGC